jgi:hypothetical protein
VSGVKAPAGTLSLLILLGCSAGPGGDSAAASKQTTTASVVDQLKASGLRVESRGSIEQSFFSVPATVYAVDGDDLQLYEYPTAPAAEKDAAKVAPNGAIGTSMPMWIAPPHFFRRDQIIAIYLGSSAKNLEALRQTLGQQFAGQ